MPFHLAVLALVGVTLIWGTTFVVIKDALETMPVPVLLALRFSLTALAFVWVPFDRRVVKPALVLGVIAFIAYGSQTLGLNTTTASKAAFITGLSVVLTPIVSAFAFKQRVPGRAWWATALATVGLGLLTLRGSALVGPSVGDAWVLLTALSYALHITYLGSVARRGSALALAGMQHLPMAALAWLWAAPQAHTITTFGGSEWSAVIYLAAVATAVVAVVQVNAQRVVPPYLAALIFVLEPVFAALLAYLVLGERLSGAGWLGAGIVFAAMLVAELKPRRALAAWRVRRERTRGA